MDPHRRRSVLIVEDSRDLADSMAMLIRVCGYDVRVEYDGIQGLEAARTYRPDVVILDVGLPGLNGHEVARSLRHDEGLKAVRIIMHSAYSPPDGDGHAYDHYLIKPLEFDRLLPLLRA